MRIAILVLLTIDLGAMAQDPGLLLWGRIKAHMQQELSHVPNYTCLETVARYHRTPLFGGIRTSSALWKMRPLDTLVLEIASSADHEWYAWPGEKNFNSDDPGDFVKSGMIGNGIFALTANKIFLSNQAHVTFQGEEELNGRRTIKFNFHMSHTESELQLDLIGGRGKVGEDGSFWVDPESLDLVRLESHAVEVPTSLPLDQFRTVIIYARNQIGPSFALLPQQGQIRLSEGGGRHDTFDHMEFTHCRLFQAQSTVRFDVTPEGPAPESRGVTIESTPKIPALLKVALRLVSPLASTDPIGTLIDAKIDDDVVRDGKVILPKGAPVHGRIRKLEHVKDSEIFLVGLEFIEVEWNGQPARFYADLLSLEKRGDVRASLTEQIIVPGGGIVYEAVPLREIPGVAQFFVTGPLSKANGLRMVWRTRGELHGLKTP